MRALEKAIVIGGGIAGPALAIQLKRMNIGVEIFEARSEQALEERVFLGMTPNGLNVLRDLIDLSVLREEYTPGTMRFFNARNQCIGELSTKEQATKYGVETIQVKRALVSRLLRDAASNAGIPIHYGKRLTALNESNTAVSAKFQDGTKVSGDVLFGCDGIHSVCRNLLFPNPPKPVYTKQLSAAGFTRMDGVDDEFGSIKMIFGTKAFFAYALSNKGEIWWFNNFYNEDEPSNGGAFPNGQVEFGERLLSIHASDHETVREIIRDTHNIYAYPIYEYPSLPQWYKGKVCLLGDAAHATAPHIGQGASLALEDTRMLALCIRDCPSLSEAFSRFKKGDNAGSKS